jgi:hypothetical protein
MHRSNIVGISSQEAESLSGCIAINSKSRLAVKKSKI